MALSVFDIRTLTAAQYIAQPYPQFLLEQLNGKSVSVGDVGYSEVSNDLGVPYFMDFWVTLPELGRVRLPHEPLLTLSRRKNIVKTATVGSKRNGTVKEYITADDFHIDIKGVCVDAESPDKYPAQQMNIIKRLCEVNEAVPVENDLLRFFGVYKLVVESEAYADMKGVPGAQAYNIKALSDDDFYAELNNVDRRNFLR